MNKLLFLTLGLSSFLTLKAQLPDTSGTVNRLKKHVEYLASDALKGRQTGSEGEKLASDYISSEFQQIGLDPLGDKLTWLQAFPFTAKRFLGNDNAFSMRVRETLNTYQLGTDFRPVNFSGSGVCLNKGIYVGTGIIDSAKGINDYKNLVDLQGRIFVMQTSVPGGYNPHGPLSAWDIRKKAELAISLGASGIIFVNNDSTYTFADTLAGTHTSALSIPIIFSNNAQLTRGAFSTEAIFGVHVDIQKDERYGHNVIGFLNNGAPRTVVIGAHYDHLGFNEYGGSLYRGSKPDIHHGADDNASGTAALIELARWLKTSRITQTNFLFIAFSGEELGLYGSNYFVKHPTINLESVHAMLNMDMVGRLDTTTFNLAVSGTGTSTRWHQLLDSIPTGKLHLKTSESGVGPSDHTSFYLQKIPVLHFFSGTHPDYHKPGDVASKINYLGMANIMAYEYRLVDELNHGPRLIYVKTKDEDDSNKPRFKVTLGIVPDYMYDGTGVRADGVSEGKPAFAAGILAGDVILSIGGFETPDMTAYMKALGQFSKGDTADVKVMRKGKEMVVKVTF